MMAKRNIEVDHSTISRWVIKYAPLLEHEFRKNYKRPVGISWRMDETYIKIKGKCHYLYRAVDKEGNTIDFMLSKKRDEMAAKQFLEKAIRFNGLPEKVTIDKSGANKAGLDAVNLQLIALVFLGYALLQINIRQIKYLNNIVEQNHRGIKRIVNPMMGFKSFYSAQATIA
jgi:putative transposase